MQTSRFCVQLQKLLKSWNSRLGLLRSISQAKVNYNEEDRKSYDQVWQSWVIQILKEAKEREKNLAENKDAYIRRPTVEERERLNTQLQNGVSVSAKLLKRKKATMASNRFPVDKKLIWVDCEMSGLDINKEKLLEIGMIVTDENLNVIAKHDEIVIHVEESVLTGMGEWCAKTHGESGLVDACRKSEITHEAADEMLLKFVQEHTPPNECPMAGNSIYMDRVFIERQLPKLHSHFHYRNVDVSTLKELVRRWYPDAYAKAPKKKYSHRVLDDIRDSIEELKYYRSAVFVPAEVSKSNSNKRIAKE